MEMEGILICAGDFNIMMNSKLDIKIKKKTNSNHVTKMATTFKEFGIIDIWRELHPAERDYTHYSAPDKSYTRIDYLFMNKNGPIQSKGV